MGDLNCWICDGEKESVIGELCFDSEYDTFYHERCLELTEYDSITEYEKNKEAEHSIRHE